MEDQVSLLWRRKLPGGGYEVIDAPEQPRELEPVVLTQPASPTPASLMGNVYLCTACIPPRAFKGPHTVALHFLKAHKDLRGDDRNAYKQYMKVDHGPDTPGTD